MPLTDSFLLATNSSLTVEFSGEFNLTHETDLSDNPQDTTLWLGSLIDTRQIDATSNPGVDDIEISVIDILPVWESETEYSLGDCVQPITPNGFRYRCVQAGTSDESEPTFPVVGIGTTVEDGTAIWELQAAKHETTEITLATSEEDLDMNTPGDPLVLGTTITGGTANAAEIWIRVENDVDTVTNTGTIPDIALSINSVVETMIS